MQWLWTWKGKSFGYRQANNLRLRDGTHVGSFVDDFVFSLDGAYLGEIRSGNRLITHKASKSSKKGPRVRRKTKLVGQVERVSLVGLAGRSGYEDFPDAEAFK